MCWAPSTAQVSRDPQHQHTVSATPQALHPQGSCVLTSSRTGKLTLWDLSGLDVSAAAAAGAAAGSASATAAAAASGVAAVSKDSWMPPERPESSAVDCIRFLTGRRLEPSLRWRLQLCTCHLFQGDSHF